MQVVLKVGLLENLDREAYREVRRTVIGAIYATDMANHFTDISKFKNRIQVTAYNASEA